MNDNRLRKEKKGLTRSLLFLEKKLKKPLTSFDIYYIIIIEERKYKQENKGEMKNES